jgi:hypothetical protein
MPRRKRTYRERPPSGPWRQTPKSACSRFLARPTRGQSWAGRRAPIRKAALLERGRAQFWIASVLYTIGDDS